MLRCVTLTFLLAAAGPLTAGPAVVLYAPGLEAPAPTLTQQGWQEASTDFTSNFYSAGAGVTVFDSRYRTSLSAGWATHGTITGNRIHPLAPVLDAAAGFTVHFQVAVDAEVHTGALDYDVDGLADGAGFSLIVLASDQRGVMINFWQDRVWIASDDLNGRIMFTHAAGVAQSPMLMGTLRQYALTVLGNAWRLSADGVPLLDGARLDYRNYPGLTLPSGLRLDPLDKANIIAPGDATLTSAAAVRLGPVSVETCFTGAEEVAGAQAVWQDGQFHVEWNSIPGRRYRVEWSLDLTQWEPETDPVTAQFFTTRRTAPAAARFARVLTLVP